MKLIRDKLALTPAPENRTVIVVNRSTQSSLILDKLLEEAHEVWRADSRQEMIQELGDLTEVFYRLLELHEITLSEVRQARQEKAENRGIFDGGYVLL